MMRILLKLFLCVSVIGSLLPGSGSAKTNAGSDVQCFKHNIQLQLSDANGFFVENANFWVTLDIIKQGNLVTIQFPLINFQTGPESDLNPIPAEFLFPGGYLYTSDGFLPESIRPSDLIYRSIVAASNNGASLPFSFADDISALPVPPVGYILSVTSSGAVVVQCAGTFGNIIPPGPQILMPCSITYVVKPAASLCNNTIIDTGFANTTQFTGRALSDGLRDSHVNDAHKGVYAWTWVSNANIADKTNNTVNVFVAIGSSTNGILSVGQPIQLSDLAPGLMAWDTAVAINRTNSNNIVVSYAVLDHSVSPSTSQTFRAVSFDGGKTWPLNGPTNIQPTGTPSGLTDNPGVAADKFGNIWYATTNKYNSSGTLIGQPTFWISTDGGDTYSVAFTFPDPSTVGGAGASYDFPQYCFGQDGSGNYGIWAVADFFPAATGDFTPAVGFGPITGVGTYGSLSIEILNTLANVNTIANITASSDGRVWMQGLPNMPDAGSQISAAGIVFKSPGALDSNYAGPWQFTYWNAVQVFWGAYGSPYQIMSSQPNDFGYFVCPRSILFDEARQALYAIFVYQTPDYSENGRLFMIISRDNGQTWSDPINIATTVFANRGFQSMALDEVTGDLVFGWYDGRNDPTYQSVQYMGAILPAAQLDALVNRIPLSDPVYDLGPAT